MPGSIVPDSPVGTTNRPWHFWHLTFLPASSSARRKIALQPGQVVEIGMADILWEVKRGRAASHELERRCQFTRLPLRLATKKAKTSGGCCAASSQNGRRQTHRMVETS